MAFLFQATSEIIILNTQNILTIMVEKDPPTNSTLFQAKINRTIYKILFFLLNLALVWTMDYVTLPINLSLWKHHGCG